MKKRNKKYNKIKSGLTALKSVRKNISVMCLPTSDQYARIINTKTLKEANLHQVEADLISGYRHKWRVTMAVFLRSQLGQEYIKAAEVESVYDCYHADLAGKLNKAHQEMIDQCNPHHVVAAGWVASPFGQECDTETIDKLFTKHEDIWNQYVTRMEHEKNNLHTVANASDGCGRAACA